MTLENWFGSTISDTQCEYGMCARESPLITPKRPSSLTASIADAIGRKPEYLAVPTLPTMGRIGLTC